MDANLTDANLSDTVLGQAVLIRAQLIRATRQGISPPRDTAVMLP